MPVQTNFMTNVVKNPGGNIADNRERYASLFTDKANDTISMDTFYKLLTAEMSKQDPLEPMSNTEFISQMASFSSLQVQNNALYYNNANYAQSLVGKSVTVAVYDSKQNKMVSESGVVTSMHLSGESFSVVVNGKEYQLKNIMEVLPAYDAATALSYTSEATYAASLIGKKVIAAAETDAGTVVDEGIVKYFEIKNGEVSVVVNDIGYPISAILKVGGPDEVLSGAETEDFDWETDETSENSEETSV